MRFAHATWIPYLRISALTGRSIAKVWSFVDRARAAHERAVTTSALNKLLTEMREFGHTVTDGKRRLRMNYVTQTGTKPPYFTFFVNNPDMVTDSYRRYVENRIRKTFDFEGTPIRLRFRSKDTRKDER